MPRSIASLLVALAGGLTTLGAWESLRASADPELPKANAPAPASTLESRFNSEVKEFVERYCISCHGPRKQSASLDLSRDLTMAGILKNAKQWNSAKDDWLHIEDADRYGRGGLLPMAVFLTKNAPGLRTSPVKRGYWVVRNLLGERIPPPPPTVPELPKDEAKLGELTLPQVLARHRADKACAGCHNRFDSVGLAFEGFGPVGERRSKDLGGKPVETRVRFPDGGERTGVDGLRDYLRAKRQAEFLDNLNKKLLTYALGRGLQLSDEKLLAEMRANLEANRYAIGNLVGAIVLSPQFLNKRGRDDVRE